MDLVSKFFKPDWKRFQSMTALIEASKLDKTSANMILFIVCYCESLLRSPPWPLNLNTSKRDLGSSERSRIFLEIYNLQSSLNMTKWDTASVSCLFTLFSCLFTFFSCLFTFVSCLFSPFTFCLHHELFVYIVNCLFTSSTVCLHRQLFVYIMNCLFTLYWDQKT